MGYGIRLGAMGSNTVEKAMGVKWRENGRESEEENTSVFRQMK